MVRRKSAFLDIHEPRESIDPQLGLRLFDALRAPQFRHASPTLLLPPTTSQTKAQPHPRIHRQHRRHADHFFNVFSRETDVMFSCWTSGAVKLINVPDRPGSSHSSCIGQGTGRWNRESFIGGRKPCLGGEHPTTPSPSSSSLYTNPSSTSSTASAPFSDVLDPTYQQYNLHQYQSHRAAVIRYESHGVYLVLYNRCVSSSSRMMFPV